MLPLLRQNSCSPMLPPPLSPSHQPLCSTFARQLQVGKSYAGRASVAACLDLFITLLSMGEEGWRRLIAEREALVEPFR